VLFFLPHFHNPPTLIRPPLVSRQCGDDDGSGDAIVTNCSNGGAMIIRGVGAMMMMSTANDASASIASFAKAWSTTSPTTTPPPTAVTTTTIGGGGGRRRHRRGVQLPRIDGNSSASASLRCCRGEGRKDPLSPTRG